MIVRTVLSHPESSTQGAPHLGLQAAIGRTVVALFASPTQYNQP